MSITWRGKVVILSIPSLGRRTKKKKKKSFSIISFTFIIQIGRIEEMQVNERILLIIAAFITAISALFCIISLATPRWSLISGLYCSGCSVPASGLAIVAFILLIIATVVLILYTGRILPNSLRLLSIIILFLGTIFTLASFASYWDAISGYSYKLMVVSNFLCYIASIITAFWLGGGYVTLPTRT